MKRSETIIIESVLYQDLFGTNPSLAKEYGTTEITIQFPKKKKELVDFMSYDARKDIFRCYEIKVSMNDFRSKAAKLQLLSLIKRLIYAAVIRKMERTGSETCWNHFC